MRSAQRGTGSVRGAKAAPARRALTHGTTAGADFCRSQPRSAAPARGPCPARRTESLSLRPRVQDFGWQDTASFHRAAPDRTGEETDSRIHEIAGSDRRRHRLRYAKPADEHVQAPNRLYAWRAPARTAAVSAAVTAAQGVTPPSAARATARRPRRGTRSAPRRVGPVHVEGSR
jgi:hypothetical protein